MSDGWAERELAEITTFASGYSFPPTRQGKAIGRWPYFKVSDMNSVGNEMRMIHSQNWIDEDDLRAMKAKIWPAGTVIFPKVGAALLTEKRRILTSEAGFDNNVMGLVPGPSIVPGFLLIAMQQVVLGEVVQSGAVPSVNQTLVGAIRVAVPPLDEQRRIVDLVACLDRNAERVATELEASHALLSALLTEWTMARPWETRRLGDLANLGSGPSWSSKDEHAQHQKGDVRVLGITNTPPSGDLNLVDEKYVSGLPTDVRRLGPQSLLMIRTNGNRARIGNVYRVPESAYWCAYSAFQIGIDVHERRDVDFVYWMLKVPAVQQRISDAASGSTGLGNIGVRWLRDLEFPWPNATQRKAAMDAFHAADHVVRRCSIERDCIGSLRSALTADLLSGRHEIPASYDRLLARVA
jgi:Type I restriction modification DNA specificity domain